MLLAVYKLEEGEWKIALKIYQNAFDSLFVLFTNLDNISLNRNLAKNISLSKKCIIKMLMCLEIIADISLKHLLNLEKARECHLMSVFLVENFLKPFEEYHPRVLANF